MSKPRLSLLTTLLTTLVLFLLSATPALAARGHVFCEKCSFTPEGAHAFKEPSGVAVNEATGDVYVVDKGNNRVEYFTAKGEFQGEFNGSGTVEVGGVPIEGKAAGSGGREGEIDTGRFEEPEGIAVDNSCAIQKLSETECEAQDTSAGDVYVVDFGHKVVDKYSPTGEYLGQITEAGGQGFSERGVGGVAVDTHGRVWVYREHPGGAVLDGFSAAEPNAFIEAVFPHEQSGIPRGSSVAVDSFDDFYVLEESGVGAREFGPKGELLNKEFGEQNASAVAVDQLTDQSFIDNLTSVRVSEPDGTEVERLGEEAGAKHLVQGAGVGVNAGAGATAGAGAVYVADAGTGQVVVFGLTEPAVPSITEASVSEVSADSADLGAEVNPRSEPGEAATTYRFEYGPCASASDCAESGYGSETAVGSLAADFEAHAVGAHVGGLTAGTTYHFRALARNSHNQPGEYVPGPERVFTTQGAGGSLVLPDDRGWELVSPPDKQGGLIEPISETGVVQAAADGSAITYLTASPTEPEPEGDANLMQVLSRRAGSWSSHDIGIAHSFAAGSPVGPGPEYKFFNPDLSQSIVQPAGKFNPALSAEASESTAFLHDLSGSCGSSCFRPLVTGEPGFSNVPEGTAFGEAEKCADHLRPGSSQTCGPLFEGATEDLSHIVLSAGVALTPGAGPGQLYEWSGGTLAHVSVLPKGEPAVSPGLGEGEAARGAISSDGSRIDWSTAQALYQRDMESGETLQLDEASCSEAEGCESGEGRFQFASTSGTTVFFTDQHKLTGDSGASPESGHLKTDLYEYNLAKPVGQRLTDVTPKRGAEGAQVQGGILGASDDGEYLYFVAEGVQSEAPNSRGQSAVAGQPNLYLRHGASTSFIATLAPGDGHDWTEELKKQPTRVSPDGRFLELMSEARLTGYDNRDVATNKPAAEVYAYDATANSLACASCDPTGARPVGVEDHKLEPGSGGLVGGPRETWSAEGLVAANVPGWTAISTSILTKARYQPRYLSDSGRLFFNSADALVPQDSNGTQDVYEYEPLGLEGSEGKSVCEASNPTYSAAAGGCVALISSGSSAQESAFMDASENGDDVFFLTSAKLSPLDGDTARDIYDAHVCTTASPCITFPNVQSPPCTTEASCKAAPTPQPTIFGAPPSATFQGLGNPPPPPTKQVVKKTLTRAQKLAKALKACKKDRSKSKRAACQKQARKRYGPVKQKHRK